jgi:hypothetical protein
MAFREVVAACARGATRTVGRQREGEQYVFLAEVRSNKWLLVRPRVRDTQKKMMRSWGCVSLALTTGRGATKAAAEATEIARTMVRNIVQKLVLIKLFDFKMLPRHAYVCKMTRLARVCVAADDTSQKI